MHNRNNLVNPFRDDKKSSAVYDLFPQLGGRAGCKLRKLSGKTLRAALWYDTASEYGNNIIW